MSISIKMTDENLLKVIGGRLAGRRLALNLTQEQLAEQAGLGLRTVQRLELGSAATQLTGFVRICRVLGLADNLDAFIPEPAVSPMEQLKLEGRKRQRATGRKAATGKPKKWNWGESA